MLGPEPECRAHVLLAFGRRLPGQREHQVEVHAGHCALCHSDGVPGLGCVMDSTKRREVLVIERLDAKRDPVHAARGIGKEAVGFGSPRVCLQRNFRIRPQKKVRPEHREQAVDGTF